MRVGDAQWTNKDRLPDRMLRELIEHFSSRTLSLANLPEDELGIGYGFLIKKFADDSGHTAAEFYTNRTVVHLMTEILQPQPGESIYDPTCGSASMLLSAVAHLKPNLPGGSMQDAASLRPRTGHLRGCVNKLGHLLAHVIGLQEQQMPASLIR
jgi:type I restriction-modification system DNA methylase subunit